MDAPRRWLTLGLTIAGVVVAAGCDRSRAAPPRPATADAGPDAATADPLAGFVMHHNRFADLGAAVTYVMRERPRVLGIGEIHERVDRVSTGTPALVRFARELLPAIAAQTSDLVIETWTVAPGCATGAANSRAIEQTMRRPAATKGHIASLFGITKANSITAHVMRLGCDDLAAVNRPDGLDAERLLGLVTRELGRVTASAVRYRDERGETRPLIVVYGGALHNDLYPPRSTREWSYALDLDRLTGERYVELDLVRPDQVEGEPLYEREPWYPLLAKADAAHVVLVERAPHSYLAILPRE
ncbi:MAG: hypothetical protein R3B06_19915 [Kofleriaceae bacterium]